MALDGIYYPHAIAGGSSSGLLKITPFDAVDVNYNYEVVESHSNADPYPCFNGIMSADPQIDFTTTSLFQILSAVFNNADSQNVVIDLSVDPFFSVFYAKGKPQGFRHPTNSSVHLRGLLNQAGMLYWTQIQARQDALATIACTIATVRKDQATDPITFISKHTLTGIDVEFGDVTSQCQALFVLGPVVWTQTASVPRLIDSLTEMTWNNNIRRLQRRTAGDFTPCWQSIHFYEPMVTIVTDDIQEAAHIGAGSQDIFGGMDGQLDIYLRRKQATGALVPPTDAGHIKLSTTGSATLKKIANITGVEPAQTRIEFGLTGSPGFGNSLFTINLASTIPTA